ncbi:HNH endonuclease family protein [Actinoplanes sp. NPDC049802]|uniref:HNH endonuclease family protein n=1 Tax=Actinoplanes sp. NPDC049802 TaxID=3154742 RepID=UPI0033E3BC31
MPPGNAPRWFPLVLTAFLLSGCEVESTPGTASTVPESGRVGASADLLADLTVAEPRSMRGYSREKFPHWRDAGENCDVRDTVLKRDGEKVKFSGCNVVAGTWTSLYDGEVLNSPTKVDIDHMVPLANAWRSGADRWTTDERGDFANDLDRPQLIAVSASSNRSKGDQDPSTWKPTEKSSWCVYAQDWIEVKGYWKLTVTEKERDSLTEMLGTC